MKKILALALALLLACAAAPAESGSADLPGSEAWLGEWICGDYMLSVQQSEENENLFLCIISCFEDDETTETWVYDGCAFDPIAAELVCENTGIKTVYSDGGDGFAEQEIFSDGAASFALDGEGGMVWTDLMGDPGSNRMTFTRYDYAADFVATFYEGAWVSENVTLYIESIDGDICANAFRASGANEVTQWSYEGLVYDEVADELNTLEIGTRTDYVYDEDGRIASAEVVFSDGAAAFRLNDDGNLVWVDYKETPGRNETAFERADSTLPAPPAEAFAEGYFRPIGAVEQGTAGASLKQAIAAAEAADFAVAHELWDPDVEAVFDNMLEAWEGLDEDERAAFDGNFADVAGLVDACLDDWEAYRGLFDDAGAAEVMEMILSDPLNRLAWENLRDITLAIRSGDAAD